METLTIWTDGSARLHDTTGGWAYVCPLPGGIWIHSGREEGEGVTNNRMELTAILMALSSLRCPRPLHLVTDSEYALKSITLWLPLWKRGGWTNSTGAAVKNRDLLEKIDYLVSALAGAGHPPKFTWTRGHDGETHNELADLHAGLARRGETMKGYWRP